MSENTKLEQLVKTAMEKIKELSECETVVGKPITTPAWNGCFIAI